MLCALYISCEEDEAHADAETEKTDAPVDKEAASGYVTSLEWFVEGTTILGKRKKHMESEHFWIGEEFKNWNLWNWSWQHRWAWYSIISWEPSGITYHFYPLLYQGVFLRVKIPNQTSADASLVTWSFILLAHFLSRNDLKTYQVFQGLSLQKIYPSRTVPTNSLNSPKLMNHTGPLAMFWQIYKHLLLGNQHLVYRCFEIHLELG